MKRTTCQFSLFIVFLLFLSTCVREDSLTTGKYSRFFDTTGAVPHLQMIASLLDVKNDSSNFVSDFTKAYGYPLWKDALSFRTDDRIIFAVPIKSVDLDSEIESVWFFSVGLTRTDYQIFTRREITRTIDDWVEQNWVFDYFTRTILHKEPSSGLDFYPTTTIKSRTMVVIEETTCVHAFVSVGGVEDDKGWHCWTETYEIFIATPKPGELEGEGGSGSIEHGTGGGITIGNTPILGTDLRLVAPNASSILQNYNMIKENWETLEKMMVKIKEKCMGESLYNALVGILRDSKINIKIVSGGSSYDASSNTLKLDLSMESNQLFHELWHAFQALYLGLDVFSKSTLNQEVEAHYAQYLYVKKLPGYKGSKWEDMYAKDPRLNTIKDLEDYIDKKGRLYPGITRDLFDFYFIYTVGVLEEHGYGDKTIYKYDDSINDIDNFTILRELTKKC